MKSHFRHIHSKALCFSVGMTLIEILIYVTLLSMLLSGFMRYLYYMYDTGLRLFEDVAKAYVK